MDEKIIIPYSSVIASRNKRGIILVLYDRILTPSDIAEKLDIRINHISNYLTELKNNKLVVCLNENSRKGRLYQLTELGKQIFIELKKNKLDFVFK